MESITIDNFSCLLGAFIESNNLSLKKVAKVIGCTEMTITRLLLKKTLPSEEMLKQVAIMIEIGFKKYSKLSATDKEKISETIGAVGGGAIGFASISATIGILGTTGLSAAGITSGLATLGAIVGGGMVAGVAVAAGIPILAGATGFGIIKLIKSGANELKVNMKDINVKWESTIEELGSDSNLS